MEKVISFSLWGNNPKYTIGALANAELATAIYPGWTCQFYVDIMVPIGIKILLSKMENVEIIEINKVGNFQGMFWRFIPTMNPDNDVVIVRDTDSRLTYREKSAVDEWLVSDKKMHTILDHPFHNFSIMPGLSGFKKGSLQSFQEEYNNFRKSCPNDFYGVDYRFFSSIFDKLKDDFMIHDEFFNRGRPIPMKRDGIDFCGRVFDENDEAVKEHDDAIRSALCL